MEFIKANPDLPWDWSRISANPNLTIEFIEENLDKQWNWEHISENPNINVKFIKSNISNIDFCKLSINTFDGYKKPYTYCEYRKK